MKVNNLITKYPEKTLVGLSVVMALFFLVVFKVTWFFDFFSYLDAWYTIKSGILDIYRTPFYPILVGVIYTIAGDAYCGVVLMCVQYAALIASVPLLFRLICFISKSVKISFWLTVFYIICPAIFGWGTIASTEAMAIAMMVYWLYFAMKLWQNPQSVKYAIIFGLLLFLMVMLRPAQLYCFGAAIIFMLFLCIRHKKVYKILISSFIGACALVLVYGAMIYRQYGVFTVSFIGTINQIASLRPIIADEQLPGGIKFSPENAVNMYNKWDALWVYNHDEFSLKQRADSCALKKDLDFTHIQQFASQKIRQNIIPYAKTIVAKLHRGGNDPALNYNDFKNPETPYNLLFWPIKLPYKVIYVIYVVSLCMLVNYWQRKKETPYFGIFVLLTGILCITTVIVGAPNDIARLSMSNIPINLMLLALIVSRFKYDGSKTIV